VVGTKLMISREVGVEVVPCSGAGEEAVGCSRPGSRTAFGGGSAMVSQETEERERAWEQKFAKCGERERRA
jgi:hypothetical protein